MERKRAKDDALLLAVTVIDFPIVILLLLVEIL